MPKKEKQTSLPNRQDEGNKKATPPDSNNALSPETNPTRDAPFMIGIGSSAGGLEVLQKFFKHMPDDTGVSIVIVTHLAENRRSLLPEIIRQSTSMPTKEIKNHTMIQPNSVYLNPPGFNVEVANNRFILRPVKKGRTVKRPVDSFFHSMASHYGSRAIGVILSGSGNDGAQGCLAIESMGGLVLAQDPEQAGYAGMPTSALSHANNAVKLSVEAMPNAICSHIKVLPNSNLKLTADEQEVFARPLLDRLFELLLTKTGNDFSQYKSNTISRRIRRRMNALQIDSLEDYVELIATSATEATSLHDQILIGVTSFFRDPDAFSVLEMELLPGLINRKKPDDTLRIWIVGCSSAEEAYSIGILVHEQVSKQNRSLEIQIFASDIDPEAIAKARKGSYPKTIQQQISPSRLKRYFDQDADGSYQVRRVIREMVVFAQQNVISDPPFTKLDLLCCRNLMIYFSSELQARLFPLFHYSLNKNGILFLGTSETADNHRQLFSPFDKKWKIYKKRSNSSNQLVNFPTIVKSPDSRQDAMSSSSNELDPLQFVEAILDEASAPTCVVINTDLNILYVHGKTGKFLEPATGRISTNLISMARAGLKSALSAITRKAFNEKNTVTEDDIVFKSDGVGTLVSITAKPINAIPGTQSELMIVIFNERTNEDTALILEKLNSSSSDKSLADLQYELQEYRENMQAVVEELQSANEELKSTNEELQSTNEELQSTNEELETSKEELQSVNEESATVNQELEIRNQELSDSSDVLKNLLDSTEVACLFLDGEFRIRTFTPRAVDLIPLEKLDHGRPISNFSTHITEDIDLQKFANDVLDRLETKEMQVTTRTGESYALKGRPYRTIANVIDGVVLTFERISEAP